MTDETDDWMNPPATASVWHDDRREKPFLILRERRIQGPLTQWDEWARFVTCDERDAALSRLRSEHPTWHLKESYYQPIVAIF